MENKNNNETGLSVLTENKETIMKIILSNMPENTSEKQAERVFFKELSNIENVVSNHPEWAVLSKKSILQVVKNCIIDNLTLNPSQGLVYLIPAKIKVGQNGLNPIYEDVLTYKPTADGCLSIARQSGSILDHEYPVITYDNIGQVSEVVFKFLVPAYGQPRWESRTFNKNHFEKWRLKSASKFGGKANANYTSWNGGIDPEFAVSKSISHGLKKRGTNANEAIRQVQNNTIDNTIDIIEKPQHIQTVSFEGTKTIPLIKATIETPNEATNEDLF